MEQGLLDLSVELSTRNITAGKEFALFVLVTNPFSKPVWIDEVNVSLPSELTLAGGERAEREIKEAEARFEESQQKVQHERGELEGKLDSMQDQLRQLTEQLRTAKDSSPDIEDIVHKLKWNVDDFQESLEASLRGSTRIVIQGSDVDRIKVGTDDARIVIDKGGEKQSYVKSLEVYAPWLIHEQYTQTRTIKLKSSLPDGVALQPGSTAIYTAVLNVKQSLIFTPSQYRLQFYVNYSFDSKAPDTPKGTSRQDIFANTVAQELSIRPSVYSVIVGATIGGVLLTLV